MRDIEELIRPIGILGGLGTQATFDIERRVIAEGQKNLPSGFFPVNVRHFPDSLMELTGDRRIPHELRPNRGLLAAAADLRNCEFIILTAHTAHLFQADVEDASGRPVLSMVDATLEEVRRRGLKNVGIMGYSTTLEHRLYQDRLDQMGIEYATISDEQSRNLDRAIDGFIEKGLPLYDLAFETQVLSNQLLQTSCEAIILACTELPLGLDLLKGIRKEALINPNQLVAEVAVERAVDIFHQRSANFKL